MKMIKIWKNVCFLRNWYLEVVDKKTDLFAVHHVPSQMQSVVLFGETNRAEVLKQREKLKNEGLAYVGVALSPWL